MEKKNESEDRWSVTTLGRIKRVEETKILTRSSYKIHRRTVLRAGSTRNETNIHPYPFHLRSRPTTRHVIIDRSRN